VNGCENLALELCIERRAAGTYVVVSVLAADVQQSAGEVGVRHLQRCVQGPERGAESIAESRESRAGARVELDRACQPESRAITDYFVPP
jgi:hypothetical protein